MGLPQLRPEEAASHDLEFFYHVSGRAGSDRRCEADAPGAAGAAEWEATCDAGSQHEPELDRFVATLRAFDLPCRVAFEPTGDYHRPLAYVLGQAGFDLSLVSSVAVARTREALYNSWDKNDPKDAQVILHLLKNGTTQRFLDPLMTGHQDLQEMANTYQQVSLRKVRLHHSLVTHHMPLYFPEAERYLHSSRAEWFTELLLFTPCPAAVRRYTKTAFVAAASEQVGGRKVDKARWLADFYDTARSSAGLPVAETSETIRMFRVVLEEYRALCERRKRLESEIATSLGTHPDFVRLQTVPGIGPILAMIRGGVKVLRWGVLVAHGNSAE